ncbi:MAG TPA: thioredoxin family protein [Chloroflexota bacterium]|nr:thioredoxin family protein [Chloroflexota bacterium]
MAVTRERFQQGMSYAEAKERMTRNRPNIERIEGLISLTDADLAPWRALPEKFNVLVLVIDPCPDVYTNLPIIQRIADATGKLDVRILMRDDNKDVMAEFMNGPYESVPVIAFYDQAMNLRSVFIERPKSVTTLREQKTREIQQANPEFGPVGRSPADMPEDVRARYQAAINEMRAATTDYYIRESLAEFGQIARELASAPSGAPQWRGNLVAAATA